MLIPVILWSVGCGSGPEPATKDRKRGDSATIEDTYDSGEPCPPPEGAAPQPSEVRSLALDCPAANLLVHGVSHGSASGLVGFVGEGCAEEGDDRTLFVADAVTLEVRSSWEGASEDLWYGSHLAFGPVADDGVAPYVAVWSEGGAELREAETGALQASMTFDSTVWDLDTVDSAVLIGLSDDDYRGSLLVYGDDPGSPALGEADALVTHTGASSGAEMAGRLEGISDVDGDGLQDVIIQASTGDLILYSEDLYVDQGIDYAWYLGVGWFGRSGVATATGDVGDVDGDGLPDIALLDAYNEVNVLSGDSREALARVMVDDDEHRMLGLASVGDPDGSPTLVVLAEPDDVRVHHFLMFGGPFCGTIGLSEGARVSAVPDSAYAQIAGAPGILAVNTAEDGVLVLNW